MNPGFTRLVAGVDFTPPSVAAARWAVRVLKGEVQVTLVYAVQVPHLPSFLRASSSGHGEIVRAAREEAEKALEELADTFPGREVRAEVRVGKPAEEIAAVAQEQDADLVVTGPHGRRSGLRDFLGSTAEQVLRVCPVPVLLVTGETLGLPTRILAPVDESDLALGVLTTALELSRTLEAQVTALHAVHPGVFRRMRLVSIPPEDRPAEKQALAGGEAWLRTKLQEAGFGDADVDVRTVVGDPAHEIVAAAARVGAELIVMGSRGSGTAGQFLLGGAARVVLANAPCPVLVVTDSA